MSNPEREYLKAVEAADLIGVGLDTIRNYAKQGLIPAYRTPGGKDLRFKRTDLDAAMIRVQPAEVA